MHLEDFVVILWIFMVSIFPHSMGSRSELRIQWGLIVNGLVKALPSGKHTKSY
jgi:hypothetical protein